MTFGGRTESTAALAFGSISDRWTSDGRSEDRIRRAMMLIGQLLAAAGEKRVFGFRTERGRDFPNRFVV